jgi:hypothetical protein
MTKATGRKVARVFDGAGSYVRVGGVTTAARSIAFAQPRPVVAAAWPDTEREFEVRFFEPERPLSGDCDVAEGSLAAVQPTTAIGKLRTVSGRVKRDAKRSFLSRQSIVIRMLQ